jgi:transposase-like protein
MNRRGQPRQRWSLQQSLTIVAATFQPGASVRGVTRQSGANAGMVFCWRKQFHAQLGFPEKPKATRFAPTSDGVSESPDVFGVLPKAVSDQRRMFQTIYPGALCSLSRCRS